MYPAISENINEILDMYGQMAEIGLFQSCINKVIFSIYNEVFILSSLAFIFINFPVSAL